MPLVESLCAKDPTVWYDIFELTPRKLLLRSIDEGLKESRFGIVVLSPNFLQKNGRYASCQVYTNVRFKQVIAPL
ncbi:TIR domain-containing protein [Chloroflexus sp.]|uniref:TIR domain-containing protein n=1 Tax=Chloroflexus sp. TaxID=1904827 RepID=UPI003C755FDC